MVVVLATLLWLNYMVLFTVNIMGNPCATTVALVPINWIIVCVYDDWKWRSIDAMQRPLLFFS